MYNFHSDMARSEHKQNAIYEEVRHIHLANCIHRAKKAKQISKVGNWMHVLSRLHRIRIQISFDLEEANPEPTGASC
jgi:hypothetical protein